MRTAIAAVALAVAVILTGCTGQHTTRTTPVGHVAPSARFAGVIATLPADHADQGVTTLGGKLLTRGHGDFTIPLVDQGYLHIGDPDSRDGAVLDAFEKNSGNVKLYRFTNPAGRAVYWTHTDAPGEMHNNSFAAISPDGRWFVSGEWGVESRLLVFAMPQTFTSQAVTLASTIRLSVPVSDIQGCDFADAGTLYCTAQSGLFPVTLTQPLDGVAVVGTVGQAVAMPPAGSCVAGQFEAEGIDVTGTTATVVVNTPGACPPQSLLYRFDLP